MNLQRCDVSYPEYVRLMLIQDRERRRDFLEGTPIPPPQADAQAREAIKWRAR